MRLRRATKTCGLRSAASLPRTSGRTRDGFLTPLEAAGRSRIGRGPGPRAANSVPPAGLSSSIRPTAVSTR